MSRTLRQARRAVAVLSLAALAVVASGTSAHASGACPDPAVEATVNMDGTEMPGCRATFTYKGETEWWKAPVGGGQARVLLIGGGGGGGNRNITWATGVLAGGGGGGGAGGEVINKMVTFEACIQYEIGVGYSGAAALYSEIGNGIGYAGQPGGLSHISRGSWRLDAVGGQPSAFTTPILWMPGGSVSTGGYSGAAGTIDGGGGGGVGPGGLSGPPAVTLGAKTGGDGGAGQDVSASFPGLAFAADGFGGGGGGFGESAGGTASHGAGAGGKSGADAGSGVDGTGGGGGGGAQEGALFGTVIYNKAGRGGKGTVVIDFPVPASTSCSSGGGHASGGGSGSGSGGSSATRTTVRATKPKVAAGGTAIDVSVTAPGAGTALLTGAPASAPKRVTCSASKAFTGTGTARMACVPGAGVQRLRRVKAVRVKLVVAFRPASGGATQTLSVGTVTLPKVATRPIAVTG